MSKIENNNFAKNLLIFDFDETITDQDSEYEVAKNTLTYEQYQKIVEQDKIGDSETFNHFFKHLKERGLSLEDYNKHLEKLELSPKMKELFEYLKKNKSKYEILIISGDIEYVIKHVLKYHGYLDLFDDFICNTCEIQNENSERLIYVQMIQFPHDCNLCIPTQCKGLELKKFLEKKQKNMKKLFLFVMEEMIFVPQKKYFKKMILFSQGLDMDYVKNYLKMTQKKN